MQLALLAVGRKQLTLSEEDYRAILERHGGARSARDLDARGFDAVMERFRALGFVSSSRKKGFGQRVGMASPAQVQMIRLLWSEVVADPSDAALNHWLERFGVSAIRFLDEGGARKVIGALKLWKQRLETKTDGA